MTVLRRDQMPAGLPDAWRPIGLPGTPGPAGLPGAPRPAGVAAARRPARVTRGLVAGTVLSLLVTWAWALLADLTIGTAPPVRLSLRDPAGDYARLAGAATGNAWQLFAVVAVIYTVCLLPAASRRVRGRR
ncbi:MAG: hypothetical protein ACRDRJ_22920 [Streptosporangiaceae bacterium]